MCDEKCGDELLESDALLREVGRGLGIGFYALHGHGQGLFRFDNDRWTLDGLERCS